MENYYTKEGLQRLKDELEYLENVRRKQVAARIKEAIAQGDLSENAEYAEAKEEQGFIEGKINELKEKIKYSKVIKKKGNSSTADLGSTIVIEDEDGEEKEYNLVGSGEADPMNGLLSNESPIGKAFIGKSKGEKVEVETPGGIKKYTIKDVK